MQRLPNICVSLRRGKLTYEIYREAVDVIVLRIYFCHFFFFFFEQKVLGRFEGKVTYIYWETVLKVSTPFSETMRKNLRCLF